MLQEFEFSTNLMGCTLDLSIIAKKSDEYNVQSSYEQICKLGKKYELIFSRFINESELSKINAQPNTCTEISKTFAEVFLIAKDIFNKSDGYFNPLLQVSRLGYDISFKDLQRKQKQSTARDITKYNTDFSIITCKEDSSIYTLCIKDKQKLDFGGFLKGYVAEKMANICNVYIGVIVNFGGDIYTLGHDAGGNEFKFTIYNPITKKDELAIQLHDTSLATSGNYKRVWECDGKQYSHIIDHETKRNPITDLVSASVMHSNGAVSDAYATVTMTLQSQNAVVFLDRRNCKYVLIKDDGTKIISKNI